MTDANATSAPATGAGKTSKKGKSGPKAGRAPLEWVMLYINGVPISEVGMYASKRTSSVSYSVGPERVVKPKTSVAKDDAPKEEGTTPVAEQPAEPAQPVPQFLHVSEGKQTQSFALSAEQLQEYQDFQADLDATHGIFLTSFVSGALVTPYVHQNAYYLNPNQEVAYSESAYQALHNILFSQYQAGFGRYVTGKTSGFAAVMATEEGLVLLQLPDAKEVNLIGEAIDKSWQKATVSPQDRSAMAAVISRLTRKTLTTSNLVDPLDAYLASIAASQRSEGVLPVLGSTNQYPNLHAALEAALSQPKTRKARPKSETEAAKKTAKKK